MIKLLIHILHTLLTCRLSAGRGVVRRGFSNRYRQTVRIPVEIDRPGSRPSHNMTTLRVMGRVLTTLVIPIGLALPAVALDINNSAQVDFIYGGIGSTLNSNTVTVVTTPPPSVANIEFLHLTVDPLGTTLPGTEFSDSDASGTFNSILLLPSPGTINITTAYTENELVLFRITDADQNLDPTAIDSVMIALSVPFSGDIEFLRLYEESDNSGVFIGYVPAGIAGPSLNDGYLTSPDGSLVDLTYDDNGILLKINAPVTAAIPSLWQQLSTPRKVVGPGDFVGFPTPSAAHQLRNPYDVEVVYLMGGEHKDIEIATFLIDVGERNGFTKLELPGVALLLPGNHVEERCLARTVRADDSDDAARRQFEGEVLE